MMKNLIVLGAGESGEGAALLAKKIFMESICFRFR